MRLMMRMLWCMCNDVGRSDDCACRTRTCREHRGDVRLCTLGKDRMQLCEDGSLATSNNRELKVQMKVQQAEVQPTLLAARFQPAAWLEDVCSRDPPAHNVGLFPFGSEGLEVVVAAQVLASQSIHGGWGECDVLDERDPPQDLVHKIPLVVAPMTALDYPKILIRRHTTQVVVPQLQGLGVAGLEKLVGMLLLQN